ncbi:MAG: SDR family oxidoreductase [Archangium sp.]|nr:SDR family oxidoreductase [Archangium sp.]
MSKIAILGAGGRLGGRLVHEALDRQMRVNALTRDPTRLRIANELCNVFKGNVETGEGVEAALAGCRWVVSAVSSPHPADFVSRLVKAHNVRKVDRLVFVSRADDTVPVHGFQERLASVIGHRTRDVARDIAAAHELLEVSGLPWLVLKTNGLTDDAGGKQVVTSEPGQPRPGPVSRVDLARFILGVIDAPGWHSREVNVGTKI